MASVRFSKKKGESNFDQGTIANQMDSLRKGIGQVSFLQVTATPYALYLQPDDYESSKDAKEVFYPKRPSFTEVLPTHDAYVGGDDYFGGYGIDDPRHYLYIEVEKREHDALRSKDGRAIRDDRLWISENTRALRLSLVTFLLSVVVRRHQQVELDQPLRKYAMIMHSDTQRTAHNWQWEVVDKLIKAFQKSILNADGNLRSLFATAYDDISRSVKADQGHLPDSESAFESVCKMLEDGEFRVQRVNSDAQLETLLDQETAELRLRAHANLFIGGSILDRGITVPNLLSFYYGRNPKRMQADTVLQHSRMYGARPRADLAVTRFYTSFEVYSRLVQIHALEIALRESLENGPPDQGVVFIQSDAKSGVIPCAPNKVSLSDVVAVKANSILTPTNFDTASQTRLDSTNKKLASVIPRDCVNSGVFCEVDLAIAESILDLVSGYLTSNHEDSFDWDAMKGLLRYYSEESKGKVLLLVEEGRELSRDASGDRSGISILGSAKLRDLVREPARRAPALVLVGQLGGRDLGWKGGPFYWPMLASPPQAKACVFATKTAN
ncbi:Z1 domain protein [compost metagenome]